MTKALFLLSGSEGGPVTLPVFKTGERHLRCRWCVRLAHASAIPKPAIGRAFARKRKAEAAFGIYRGVRRAHTSALYFYV